MFLSAHPRHGYPSITIMTGPEIRQARADLGRLFGLGRPLRAAELGRLLRLKGRDPGATVLAWEAGDPISGPVSVAVEMMLDGARPPTFDEFLNYGKTQKVPSGSA